MLCVCVRMYRSDFVFYFVSVWLPFCDCWFSLFFYVMSCHLCPHTYSTLCGAILPGSFFLTLQEIKQVESKISYHIDSRDLSVLYCLLTADCKQRGISFVEQFLYNHVWLYTFWWHDTANIQVEQILVSNFTRVKHSYLLQFHAWIHRYW